MGLTGAVGFATRRAARVLPEGPCLDQESPPVTTTLASDQLLHLVFGGELEDIEGIRFKDLAGLDIVGIFPDYASAKAAWRAKAQATVDNAQTRYFVVHLHRLLEP